MTENTTATVRSRVGVLGGGRMGAGIAHAFLISGARVTVVEVDGLADELQRPERFCGMHFFNPVPASKLVEIVIGRKTRQELKELTLQWVAGIGKTPATVNDAPASPSPSSCGTWWSAANWAVNPARGSTTTPERVHGSTRGGSDAHRLFRASNPF